MSASDRHQGLYHGRTGRTGGRRQALLGRSRPYSASGFVMYDPMFSRDDHPRFAHPPQRHGPGEGDLLFCRSLPTRATKSLQAALHEAASSFRSHFAYDNLLYMTAADHSAVTGTSWDELHPPAHLRGARMEHSNVSNAGFKPGDDYAFPHSRMDGKLQVIHFEVLDNVGPAGSINSLRRRHGEVVQLQLNRGKFHRPRRTIVQRTPVKRDVVAADHSSDRGSTVPFGGIETEFRGTTPWAGVCATTTAAARGHTGGVAGFSPVVCWCPRKSCVVVLTNAEARRRLIPSCFMCSTTTSSCRPPTGSQPKAVTTRKEKKRGNHKKSRKAPRRRFQTLTAAGEIRPITTPVMGPSPSRERRNLVITFDPRIDDRRLQHWQSTVQSAPGVIATIETPSSLPR